MGYIYGVLLLLRPYEGKLPLGVGPMKLRKGEKQKKKKFYMLIYDSCAVFAMRMLLTELERGGACSATHYKPLPIP